MNSDSPIRKILDQTSGKKRTARQVITEREVINDLVKVVADVNVRVSQLPAKQQPTEREALLKDALAKVRRDHRTSREEMRRILGARTSSPLPSWIESWGRASSVWTG